MPGWHRSVAPIDAHRAQILRLTTVKDDGFSFTNLLCA